MSRGYSNYFKPVGEDLKFQSSFRHSVVTSVDGLEAYLTGTTRIGLDTETTGLDFINDSIVGFSVSKTSLDGIYIPVRHSVGKNAPLDVLNALIEWMTKNLSIFYNSFFDLQMLKQDSFLDDPDVESFKTFEVQALTFNADTASIIRDLKGNAKHYLGRDCPTFEEVTGTKGSFANLDPIAGAYYAACDSSNTLGLFEVLFPRMVKECKFIIKLDNALSKAMAYYNTQEQYIDSKVIKQVDAQLEEEAKALKLDIFRKVGYPFNINSNRQLSQALLSIGVDTGQRTKLGDMVLSAQELGKLDHPVVDMVIRASSISTLKSAYSKKFMDSTRGRFSYNMFLVPTGRLASGNKKNPYYMKMNFQNIPKPAPAFYHAVPSNSSTAILGWEFKLIDPSITPNFSKDYIVEGYTPDSNLRQGITVEDPTTWYYLAVDYSQEELMFAGFLAGEKVLTQAFENGEDVHYSTAINMYGKENYTKEKRKLAKMANFELLYGGSKYTLFNTSGLSLEVCESLYRVYWNTLRILANWKRRHISLAYKNDGVVYSHYGRPRRLKHWLSSTEHREKKFGERSVSSQEIQGSCGDVMRIVMVKLYKEIFKARPDHIRFVGTIHDEIDFAVRKDRFNESVNHILKIMSHTPPGFPQSLLAEIEVGTSYGMVWPFEREGETWKPTRAK